VGDVAPSTVSVNQTHVIQTAAAQHSGFIKVAADSASQSNPSAGQPPEMDTTTEESSKETPQVNKTTAKPDPVKDAFEKYAARLGPVIYLMILGALLLYMLVILLVVAYMQSRITNLVFNSITLDHIGFLSNQRMRDLVWLYLSNIMLVMFSAGLATPWAQIRMIRYRMEHLAMTGETDWDKFVGEKKDASRAMGEEIADMFDIDLSFG
jgi:uncharacterized membrane protein